MSKLNLRDRKPLTKPVQDVPNEVEAPASPADPALAKVAAAQQSKVAPAPKKKVKKGGGLAALLMKKKLV